MNAGAPLLPPDFACHWARALNCKESSLVRLQGGINNRVYRCGEDGRHQWVIKGYAPLDPGARDRMQAEVDFLRFAEKAAPGFTPGLIQVDVERRCVVLEYLEGKPFSEGVPPPKRSVDEAVEFFRQLNAEPLQAHESIHLDAAEGFLSMNEHLGNVRERLQSLNCLHLDPELRPQAQTLLQHLKRELAHSEERISKMISQGVVSDTIDLGERCVSPSDFGFHNAILTTSGTRFIDFEFAGWDDPAKALVDFIHQPRVPVPGQNSPLSNAINLEQRSNLLLRYDALKPVLRIKWVCIILAVLRPERLDEISLLTLETNKMKLASERLRSAQIYLNRISMPLSDL